jgi:CRP-like cAMP-binding protein
VFSEPVRLLEVDPDLGYGLPDDQRDQATQEIVVRTMRVPTGRWAEAEEWNRSGRALPMLGLLMLDGLILRDLDLGRRSSTEVLGAGDLLRPWEAEIGADELPLVVRWTVLDDARLAVIDERALSVIARYPPLIEALVERVSRRNRRLSLRLVINQLVRLEDRLLIALWALAERWGRVTPEGVLVPMELTHSSLARLVGARRPSVTTALGVLGRDRLLERTPEGWLLRGTPSEIVEPVAERLGTSA